jgi:hypothetical protein
MKKQSDFTSNGKVADTLNQTDNINATDAFSACANIPKTAVNGAPSELQN